MIPPAVLVEDRIELKHDNRVPPPPPNRLQRSPSTRNHRSPARSSRQAKHRAHSSATKSATTRAAGPGFAHGDGFAPRLRPTRVSPHQAWTVRFAVEPALARSPCFTSRICTGATAPRGISLSPGGRRTGYLVAGTGPG